MIYMDFLIISVDTDVAENPLVEGINRLAWKASVHVRKVIPGHRHDRESRK